MSASKMSYMIAGLFGGASTIGLWYQFDRPSLIPAVKASKNNESKYEHQGSQSSACWDDNWDRRKHAPVHEHHSGDGSDLNRPTATRNLILIRHGQYVLNATRQEEKVLTILGRRQAQMTGERLKLLNLPVDRIAVSTKTRARETGDIIARYFSHVPVSYCDFLPEGCPTEPEPHTTPWRPKPHVFYQDGARIEAAFRKYFHRADVEQKKDSYELIVCHANVIRYFVCRALQLPPEDAWLKMSIHNGSVTWIRIGPSGRVSLRMLGACGFMDPEGLSTT